MYTLGSGENEEMDKANTNTGKRACGGGDGEGGDRVLWSIEVLLCYPCR
jgi:hypothetical protein